MKIHIGYLYGDLMNIYGDTGNIIALQKRCQWRGIDCSVNNISTGDVLKSGQYDIYFFGGGQDQSQTIVSKDLSKKESVLKKDVEKGVPLLSVCGGYQLLGQYYRPQNGPKLPGIGLFPAYTHASDIRMIRNLVIESNFGKLIGFENHSGKTFLEKGASPLGKVIKGFGNNGEDKTEGCIYKNAIGCYMHGSLLPKNPVLADWLIKKALEVKYGKEIKLEEIDNALENKAHDKAVSLFG
ncbi:glutamine amidotransferase [Candidatus Daviesbacteria bacterium]|nr:glutamine amidotransferase [Candidatus Daviesbacteria bacterium]